MSFSRSAAPVFRPSSSRTNYRIDCNEEIMKRTSLILYLLFLTTLSFGQSGAKNGEWRSYGGDLGNTHYSSLDQINAGNFNKLEMVWHFKTDNLGPRPEFQFEGTPLMANGVLYSTAGTRRAVIALDAATGELMWTHSE